MNYRRLLVLATLGEDPRTTFATLWRLVPRAARITVIAERPRPAVAWVASVPPPGADESSSGLLEELHEAARNNAPSVDVAPATDLTPDALADAVAASGIDLVVVGSQHHHTLALASALQKRNPVAVLCVGAVPLPARPPGQGLCLSCVTLSAPENAAMLHFLRDRAGATHRAVLLESSAFSAGALAQLREVTGLASQLELVDGSDGRWRRLFDARTSGEFDLVVCARFPPLVLLDVGTRPPVLVIPPLQAEVPERDRALDPSDAVDDGTRIRLRLDYTGGVGRRTPIDDQEIAFVRAGEIVARETSFQGEVELPSGLGDSLGILRTHSRGLADPTAAVEVRIAVLRAGHRPVLLFDSELDDHALSRLRAVPDADAWAVRIRPTRTCASIRHRLESAGLLPYVLDAGALLGEGDAPDVPEQADGVRLARAARRLRASGVPVGAIVHRGPRRPEAPGLTAVVASELDRLAPPRIDGPPSPTPWLDAVTSTLAIEGNRVQIELDNSLARGWVLSAIECSRQRLHFQVYMASDDDVGRPVEQALAAAGARGVTVRVLVDSLHGLHGSLGLHNPLLDRLASRPGVELRVGRPITGPPSVEDLKQRDHRKLVVADGRVALLGGRNLSHEYYAAFAEVPLQPDMHWRMVPWLDAGARVEGPAVAAFERGFLQAWMDSGGQPFKVQIPPAAGTTRARAVMHRGLRDAHTLEAYLAMIDGARSHVRVVSGFPLMLEIQHALLRAVRRGVRVRMLLGNLTPRHGHETFHGPMATGRIAATSFVQSRIDPLVAAGAECYEFVVPRHPSWAPTIQAIRTHVHAKTMSVDGRLCAVGSANLDVTGSYWEDELLLVVEDEAVATALEVRFDQLMAGSDRFDRTDAQWQRRAEQRRWMRYWPGVLG